MPVDEVDRLLVSRIRAGDPDAWSECIARFQGRLLAFLNSRLNDHATSEDLVQETFLGFLTGLANYHDETPLESFLFAIAAHKLTDHLRRLGRRPTRPLTTSPDSSLPGAPVDPKALTASNLAYSGERRTTEQKLLTNALGVLVNQWFKAGDFERLKCMELLFVLGWGNKQVAQHLGISEQAVANHKSYVISRLSQLISRETLSDAVWRELTPPH